MKNVYETIRAFTEYQYTANRQLPLSDFHTLESFGGYHLHPGFLDFAAAERKTIAALLNEEITSHPSRQGLLNFCLTQTQSYLYENNQFITLTQEHRTQLAQLYREYFREMVDVLADQRSHLADAMRDLVERHLRKLQTFIWGLDRSAEDHPLLNHQAVCAEYSPELQLRILGVDLDTLLEPVLDIGCGMNAKLVTHLRDVGIEAYGVDRLVTAAPYLIEADWIEFALEPESWGTILSHMAFSNHFLFHHYYRYGVPGQFAAKYREFLDALKDGGSLHYAPPLPFIEQFLPRAQYAVQQMAPPLRSGATAASATCITKRHSRAC